MYSSCFAINFSLHTIICKYLISLSIIISIKLYLFPIVRFVNLNNLIMKFIVTSSYNDLSNF